MNRVVVVAVFLAGSTAACNSDALDVPGTDVHDFARQFEDPPDLSDPPGPLDFSMERDRDAACAQVSAQAMLTRKPVDIIFIIDNSGSFSDEIHGVEQNINVNFADLVRKSGIDYRLIMLSHYGNWNQQRICVAPPLSKQTMNCMPPDAMVMNNPPRYFHYNWDIQSWDSFKKAITQYKLPDLDGNPKPPFQGDGWSAYLRKDAVKVFVEVTDDKSDMPAAQMDAALLQLDPKQFGTAKKRNYIVHSIIGVASNVPPTKPWGPKDPLQAGKCGNGVVTNGMEYQELSILTGGLRFPVCEWMNFDGIFKEVAKGVVDGVKVSCDFMVPAPPPGSNIDPESLVVEYTPSQPPGSAPVDFHKVVVPADCEPDAFYQIGDYVTLCPDACTKVQNDPMAILRLLYFCQ